MVSAIVTLPVLNHPYNITNLPEAAIYPGRLGWRHAVSAADLHEIMMHRVKREGANVVFEFLRKGLGDPRDHDGALVGVGGGAFRPWGLWALLLGSRLAKSMSHIVGIVIAA